jgi:very-short-patch-repair endonuclease
VIGLLTDLTTATLTTVDNDRDDAELLTKLERESNSLEKRFLRYLTDHGYRLPDEAQQTVEGYYVRPDFAFRTAEGDVAIFIDGPVHDGEHQAGKDRAAEAALQDEAGWMVLRFHHEDGRTTACGDPPTWSKLVSQNPTVFGPGKDVT